MVLGVRGEMLGRFSDYFCQCSFCRGNAEDEFLLMDMLLMLRVLCCGKVIDIALKCSQQYLKRQLMPYNLNCVLKMPTKRHCYALI